MAGGGAAPAHKADELVPHPVKDQLPNVAYCLTSPPPWRKFLILEIHIYFSVTYLGLFSQVLMQRRLYFWDSSIIWCSWGLLFLSPLPLFLKWVEDL